MQRSEPTRFTTPRDLAYLLSPPWPKWSGAIFALFTIIYNFTIYMCQLCGSSSLPSSQRATPTLYVVQAATSFALYLDMLILLRIYLYHNYSPLT